MLFNSLNQMKAKNLSAGKYADGQGLWLVKRSKTAGKWVQRLSVHGRRREMGLGSWPDVSIAEARERAEEARKWTYLSLAITGRAGSADAYVPSANPRQD